MEYRIRWENKNFDDMGTLKNQKTFHFAFEVNLFCFFCFRNGIVGAKYLALKIAFDPNTRRLHPEPKKKAKWIIVCGVEDKE